jgi:DNA-binding transcriptional regulator/RsmH inhibitor MraZ
VALAIFMGQDWSALDGKGRFALPAAFRNPLQLQCSNHASILVRAIHGRDYLTLFGDLQAPEFLKKQENQENDDEETALADFWSGIQSVSIDAGGRFALPAFHAQHAGITDSIFIIGAGNQIQLWDLDRLHASNPRNPIVGSALALALKDRDARRGGKK